MKNYFSFSTFFQKSFGRVIKGLFISAISLLFFHNAFIANAFSPLDFPFTGFTSSIDGSAPQLMPGDTHVGYTLNTGNVSNKSHVIDYAQGSYGPKELAGQVIPLYLDPGYDGFTDGRLKYWECPPPIGNGGLCLRNFYPEDGDRFNYMQGVVTGDVNHPFVYAKVSESDLSLSLIDGFIYNNDRNEKSFSIPDDFPLGNYFFVDNGFSNFAPALNFNFIVVGDRIRPVINLVGLANIEIPFGASYSDQGATASDNVDGDITSRIVITNTVDSYVPGVYTVRYNVKDAAGNEAVEITRTVTVKDPLLYVTGFVHNSDKDSDLIVMPGDIKNGYTLITKNEAGINRYVQFQEKSLGSKILLENGKKIIPLYLSSSEGGLELLRKYYENRVDMPKELLEYFYQAMHGKEPFAYVRVSESDLSLKLFDGFKYGNDGKEIDLIIPDDYPLNVLSLIGDQNDDLLKSIKIIFTIGGDREKPSLFLNGDSIVNLNFGASYVDLGAIAKDEFDGDITSKIVTTNPVNTSVSGSYVVRYNVKDNAGNAADEITRTVNVAAFVPPSVVPPSTGGGGGGGGGGFFGNNTFLPFFGGGSVLGTSTIGGEGLVFGTSTFIFRINLKKGDENNDVLELQKRLTSEGVYSGPIIGYFGPLTKAAVKKYQKNNNIITTGFVGPLTRGALNGGQVQGANISNEKILQLQQQLLNAQKMLQELLK